MARIGVRQLTCTAVVTSFFIAQGVFAASASFQPEAVKKAFADHSINLSSFDLDLIRPDVLLAVEARCGYGPTGDNSKAKFSAVEIAQKLKLNPKTDASVVDRVNAALKSLPCIVESCDRSRYESCTPPVSNLDWQQYFRKTIDLTSNSEFLNLVNEKGFSPVKISWEDIGRYEGSVWGDRISDVGIWVRKNEGDSSSAELALSVRRDSNFRDKVLIVPSEKIKVHLSNDGRTRELTLPERLRELDLLSSERDKHVIVSNQFAIVPVPSRSMTGASREGKPPRAAFNFSIFPYGSTNFVITDVIEGSSDAIVGPGTHQYLYANVDGEKAPFTASRAEDRPDLMKLEADLKAQGMDVDVQRYYLIQVPLKKGAQGIGLSSMGTPPLRYQPLGVGGMMDGMAYSAVNPVAISAPNEDKQLKKESEGLAKVAIGHGEKEGPYNSGSGFRGMRAEEPVRVTVVYFVTPIGEVSRKDMENFSKAFEAWDESAIWGGSFVVKN